MTSETIWTHSCDLCGVEYPAELADQGLLTTVFNGRVPIVNNYIADPGRADICEDCENKPIKDLLIFWEAKWATS